MRVTQIAPERRMTPNSSWLKSCCSFRYYVCSATEFKHGSLQFASSNRLSSKNEPPSLLEMSRPDRNQGAAVSGTQSHRAVPRRVNLQLVALKPGLLPSARVRWCGHVRLGRLVDVI